MQKLAAFILSSLILVQSFNLSFHDLVQLDELIEHAQFHKAEYGDDFFTFLSKHYGELKEDHSTRHQEEQEDHEELPFNHQCVSSLFAFVIQQPIQKQEAIFNIDERESHFHYLGLVSLFQKQNIFQPPRHA